LDFALNHYLYRLKYMYYIIEAADMMEKEKDDLEREEEEKEFLLEYIKMQNEAMKRIFKNTLDKEDKEDN
jgi:hypothetical protein